jgi:hypothetical protein
MARKDSEALGFFDQTLAIRRLVNVIEQLRLNRRSQWASQAHPLQKRFSQEELRDLVPSYKNLMIGRTRRLPSRAVVLQIAEYLESTYYETNALLQAAEYAPLAVVLSDTEYQQAVAFGRVLLENISLPAQLITYGWRAEAVNPAFSRVNSLPEIDTLPHEKQFAMHCFFSRASPFFSLYRPTVQLQRENSLSLIAFFRQLHSTFLHEMWFTTLVDQFEQLPDFREAWYRSETLYEHEIGKTVLTMSGYSELLMEQWVRVPIGEAAFPVILMTIPVNDVAREVYRVQGIYS